MAEDEADQLFQYLIDIINDKWEFIKEKNGISIEKKFLHQDDEIACFKCGGLINQNCEVLEKYMWDLCGTNEIKKLSEDISYYRVLDQKPNNRICYQINNLPWPLTDREFCYYQCRRNYKDRKCILMFSVESDKVPKNEKKFIRATINISAYCFIPEDKKTRMYKVIHIDPHGSIPANLINVYSEKLAKLIFDVKSRFEN
jgi:hypothetical protein